MFRRVIAGLILGPALLIGSFAWSGYLALQTVFDEDRSETIARELLDNEEVRAQVAENLGVAIERALPDDVPVSAAQVDAAALAVLEDPRVTDLLIESLEIAKGRIQIMIDKGMDNAKGTLAGLVAKANKRIDRKSVV